MKKLALSTSYAAVLGAVIRRERVAMGLDQSKLAGILDLGQTGVSRIERGAVCCTVDTLDLIGQALKVGASELLKRAEDGRTRLVTRGVKVGPTDGKQDVVTLGTQSLQSLLFDDPQPEE